ncbi:50S ribosomal protein L24 [Desulfovermiculus halophilus]|uniref:50S ribosomal protein L24 n=1 Tax=Desulfovermiculus halophilus TaxID=339722 RepID=UPI0004847363|nr:50S ribosomal protein L24 [Desulfovermiculus halophilus]
MRKNKIRVNDKVMVMTGKDRGKVGTVKSVLYKDENIVVDQVNMVKRHVKGNPYTGKSGGIQDKEAPMHISNVALVCDSCTKPTRIGFTYTEDGRKLRFCKKCHEMLD